MIIGGPPRFCNRTSILRGPRDSKVTGTSIKSTLESFFTELKKKISVVYGDKINPVCDQFPFKGVFLPVV